MHACIYTCICVYIHKNARILSLSLSLSLSLTHTHTHTHTGFPGAGAEAGGKGSGHEEAEPGNLVPVCETLQLLGTHSQQVLDTGTLLTLLTLPHSQHLRH